MTDQKIKELLDKYLQGNCTPMEQQLLELWLTQCAAEDEFEWANEEEKAASRRRIIANLQQQLDEDTVTPVREIGSSYKKWVVAACVLFLVSIGAWLYVKYQDEHMENSPITGRSLADTSANEVSIVMPDGAQIAVSDTSDTATNILQNAGMRRVGTEEVVLGETDTVAAKGVTPSGLIVPKGKTFRLTLADGTKVWLNTASVIRFSSDQANGERHVLLEEGEAYFEVTRNENRPFRVTAQGTDVKVLGTIFNVKAYADEGQVVTTLCKGSVEVSNGKKTVLLKPSQQAISLHGQTGINTKHVDVKHALAWQKDFFVFDNKDIEEVMREVSRWYGFQVRYDGPISSKKFGGTFAKSKDIGELLEYLASINHDVRFERDGNKVRVIHRHI